MGTVAVFILCISLITCMGYIGYKSVFCVRWWLYTLVGVCISLDVLYCNAGFSIFECSVSFSLGLSVVLVLYVALASLQHLRFSKYLLVTFDLILIGVVSLPLVVKKTMGVVYFNRDYILALMQSNFNETALFLYDNLSVPIVVVGVVVMIIVIAGSLHSKVVAITSQRQLIVCAYSLAVFILSVLLSSGIHYIMMYIEEYESKVAYLKRNVNADYSVFTKAEADSLTFVIVLGESVSRDNMSVYGYDKQTTPNMSHLVNDGEWLMFKNSYSSGIFTAECVPKALSSQSQFCKCVDYIITDIFSCNGFHTAWISNQCKGGFDDNVVAILSEHADFRVFSDEVNGDDMDLLPYVRQKITTWRDNALFLLHLKGSHFPYNLAYPKNVDYGYVLAHSKQDHYDNSLRYNDAFMNTLFDMIKDRKRTILIYTSDHGEKPTGSRLDDSFEFPLVRVPLFVYFSPDMRTCDKYHTLMEHRDKYWSNELLFNLVCGLLNIKNDEILKPEWNLSSPMYNLDKSDFTFQNGRFHMSDDKD